MPLRTRQPLPPVDVILPKDGEPDFARMRWGLFPYWWSKPLKKVPATFNARVESVAGTRAAQHRILFTAILHICGLAWMQGT